MDQLYFESGYLVDGYYTIVREAEAALPLTVTVSAQGDIADATGYYIPDYIVTDYFVSGQILQADAALSVTVTQSASVERIIQAAANVNVTMSKSCTVTRFTQSAVTLNVAAANTCTVTRIIDGAAAITAAFAPTLTADAFKNHTAVLDSVSTMSVDAVANRSANILLDYITDLNAMAAKTVDVVSTASTTATQSTTAVKTVSPSISLSSSAAITCILGEVHSAQSQLTANSSLSTSRYFGKNRPRNIVETGDNNYINYFNTAYNLAGGTHGIYSGADSPVIFGGPLSDIVPTANESWVLSFSYVCDGTTTARSFFYSFTDSTGSERFLRLATTNTTGSQFQLNLFKTGQSTVTQTFTVTQFTTTRIAISYHNGYVAVFKDGVRTALIDLTAQTSTTWTGHNQLTKTRWSIGANTAIDEFHYSRGTFLEYNPQSTSVTATNLQVNSPTTTEVLWHLDGNGLDDITVTESAQSALQSAFTQQTIGSGTFVARSAEASLSSTVVVAAQVSKSVSATANLATMTTLSVVIGSVKDSITLNAGAFTVTAQESRLRDAASSMTSAFAPTLTAQATRSGDITMSTVFAMSTTATSFTDSTADIAAAFSVSAAVDGITRLGAAAVSSEFNQTTTIGRLQSVSVPITSAFSTVMNVAYFEGTSLIAPMAAVMSVTAVKTARITKTLSAVIGLNSLAFNAVHDPDPVLIPHKRALFHFDTVNNYIDSYGGTHTFTGVALSELGYNQEPSKFGLDAVVQLSSTFQGIISNFPVGTGTDNFTIDWYWRPYADFKHTETQNQFKSILRIFNDNNQSPIHLEYRNPASGTTSLQFRLNNTTVILPPVANRGPTPGSGREPYVSVDWHHCALQRSGSNLQLWFQGSNVLTLTGFTNTVNNKSSWGITEGTAVRTFQQIDELRIYDSAEYSTTFTPPSSAYDVEIEFFIEKNGYAVLDSRTEFSVSALIIFLGQASAQVLTAISADVRRIRQGVINLSSTVTTAINAGKNVEIASNLASQSTISVNAVKVTETVADLTVVTAQSTQADRLRTTAVALATTATATITPVKTTGVVVNAESAVSQSATGFRIQQGESSISALYSQLSVAFQNATGTVLLETVTTMQITAEKNAVGVIALAAEFTQSTDSADAKTVRTSSAIAAEFTQVSEGLRIQPAGANVSAQFTQTANSDLSKITRVTANVATAVAITAAAARTRSTPSTLSAVTSIVCNNIVLRQASANLVDSFDILASPQFIIRVTATFSAFNSQLTVGEIINIDPHLQLKIEAETRINKIPQETRVFIIESETRVNIIKD